MRFETGNSHYKMHIEYLILVSLALDEGWHAQHQESLERTLLATLRKGNRHCDYLEQWGWTHTQNFNDYDGKSQLKPTLCAFDKRPHFLDAKEVSCI